MRIADFINFSDATQIQIIWEKGVYVGSKAHPKYNIVLYRIESFYVETVFDPAYEEIIYLEVFESLDKLDPYLKQIESVSSMERLD